jgi:phosphatidylserine/phosphatidylglycerophosphate/cardiolipin synthase-like enzyme
MTDRYIEAAGRLNWLMHRLESALRPLPDGFCVDASFVRANSGERLPNADEAAAAVDALAAIGIVREDNGALRLDQKRLQETNGFRTGVLETARVLGPTALFNNDVRLCVALPPGLDSALSHEILNEADDLRAAIFEIIASAKRQLILASPFWDQETIDELAELVDKRLSAGVEVTILGRFAEHSESNTTPRFRRLARHNHCRVVSWFQADSTQNSVQTFHFKLAIADEGRTAYLGTANFTTSGLRSRMELGVILSAKPAKQLYRIMEEVLKFARPVF